MPRLQWAPELQSDAGVGAAGRLLEAELLIVELPRVVFCRRCSFHDNQHCLPTEAGQQRYSSLLSEFLLFSFLCLCIKYERRSVRKAFGQVCQWEGGAVGSYTVDVLQSSPLFVAPRVSLIHGNCVQKVLIFFLCAHAKSPRQRFWAGISQHEQEIFQFLTVRWSSGMLRAYQKKPKTFPSFIGLFLHFTCAPFFTGPSESWRQPFRSQCGSLFISMSCQLDLKVSEKLNYKTMNGSVVVCCTGAYQGKVLSPLLTLVHPRHCGL